VAASLPATIELCARLRDGLPCLGRVHRSGVPEVVVCTLCGKRDNGVIYVRIDPLILLDSMTMGEFIDRLKEQTRA
jgi:hypothetical protein